MLCTHYFCRIMTAIGSLLPSFPNKNTNTIENTTWAKSSYVGNGEEMGGEKEWFSFLICIWDFLGEQEAQHTVSHRKEKFGLCIVCCIISWREESYTSLGDRNKSSSLIHILINSCTQLLHEDEWDVILILWELGQLGKTGITTTPQVRSHFGKMDFMLYKPRGERPWGCVLCKLFFSSMVTSYHNLTGAIVILNFFLSFAASNLSVSCIISIPKYPKSTYYSPSVLPPPEAKLPGPPLTSVCASHLVSLQTIFHPIASLLKNSPLVCCHT